MPIRATLFQPRYFKWVNLKYAQTITLVRMKFWIVFAISVLLLFRTTSVLLQSHDPHLQHSLTPSHKSLGKPGELARRKSMAIV